MKTIKLCSQITLMWVLFVICFPHLSWAVFGEDLEKPKPEFTKEADIISAKLIPRGKSTSVKINFECTGGRLAEVKGMDFELADRPEVDAKNFKSALFTIEITDVPENGEVAVAISSDFFSSATQFYIFNEKLPVPWIKDASQNVALSERVRSLLIQVKDGGPLDSDGVANGSIFLVGGPRDSFWGYALGTLFIRFFGIFIVLGVLMIGMMLSGSLFQYFEKKAVSQKSLEKDEPSLEDTEQLMETEITPEAAAAIAAALHLYLQEQRRAETYHIELSGASNWVIQGRNRMMGNRFISIQRIKSS